MSRQISLPSGLHSSRDGSCIVLLAGCKQAAAFSGWRHAQKRAARARGTASRALRRLQQRGLSRSFGRWAELSNLGSKSRSSRIQIVSGMLKVQRQRLLLRSVAQWARHAKTVAYEKAEQARLGALASAAAADEQLFGLKAEVAALKRQTEEANLGLEHLRSTSRPDGGDGGAEQVLALDSCLHSLCCLLTQRVVVQRQGLERRLRQSEQQRAQLEEQLAQALQQQTTSRAAAQESVRRLTADIERLKSAARRSPKGGGGDAEGAARVRELEERLRQADEQVPSVLPVCAVAVAYQADGSARWQIHRLVTHGGADPYAERPTTGRAVTASAPPPSSDASKEEEQGTAALSLEAATPPLRSSSVASSASNTNTTVRRPIAVWIRWSRLTCRYALSRLLWRRSLRRTRFLAAALLCLRHRWKRWALPSRSRSRGQSRPLATMRDHSGRCDDGAIRPFPPHTHLCTARREQLLTACGCYTGEAAVWWRGVAVDERCAAQAGCGGPALAGPPLAVAHKIPCVASGQ